MRRFCLLVLLISALPIPLFAASYNFDESGGCLNYTQAFKLGQPLQVNGAAIMSIAGPGIHVSSGMAPLGWVKLANGHLDGETIAGSKASGSITDTYTYSGGTMRIFNSVKNTHIRKDVMFNGSLGNETLTVTYNFTAEQNRQGKTFYVFDGRTWQLSGDVSGEFYNGQNLSGTFDITKVGKAGATGNTALSGVPEPGGLTLFATGLLGTAGLVRRRSR